MSMYGLNTYPYYTVLEATPSWIRNERYDHCELCSGSPAERRDKKNFALAHSLLSMLSRIQ